MKKIRVLQILIYMVFSLFVLQNVGDDIYRGIKEGWDDYDKDVIGKKASNGPTQLYILEGGIITHNGTDTLNIGSKYRMKNVTIQSTIEVNNPIAMPWWLIAINIALVTVTLFLLYKIASTINRVILDIYKGAMFEEHCIHLIQKTGVLVIIFSATDYAYQWYDYTKQTMTVHGPLKVVNTVSFSFGMVLCAIFVFIIAEAFKQGGKLKEEQEITI